MTKKELKSMAMELKNQMSKKRLAQATHKEIIQLIVCYYKGELSKMQGTRLYTKFSGEYCEYLEILNRSLPV